MAEDAPVTKSQALDAFKALQTRVGTRAYLNQVESAGKTVLILTERLVTLREKGYRFARDLEGEFQTLAADWQAAEQKAQALAAEGIKPVEDELSELQSSYDALNSSEGLAAQIQANKLLETLERLGTQVEAVTRQAETTLGDLPERTQELGRRLATLESYMKHAEEASFAFNAGESVYMAVEAGWKKGKSNKDNPDGIFYITDQRVIMEQKEKQAGFMGIGGKTVQGLLWEASLNSIQEIDLAPQDPPGDHNLIRLSFGEGGPFGDAVVEVREGIEAPWFVEQLRRALSGEIDGERISVQE